MMQPENEHPPDDSFPCITASSSSIPLLGRLQETPKRTRRRRRRRRQRIQPVAAAADSVNVIVASDAGKPIFARWGTETEIARICGLLQALRCSILYDVHLGSSTSSNSNNNPLGDLQCIQSGSSLLVFMHVQSIWLVAIAKTNSSSSSSSSSSACPTEAAMATTTSTTTTQAYLRLLLEYIYSQLIFHLTNQVQVLFQHNASLDLQDMLGTSSPMIQRLMHSLLNQADSTHHFIPPSDIYYEEEGEEEEEDEEEEKDGVLDKVDEPTRDDENGLAINRDICNSVTDDNKNNNNPAPFLSSCTPTLFPLSNQVREKTSEILQTIGQATQHCVFSILFTTTTTNTSAAAVRDNSQSSNNNNNSQHSSSSFPASCCKLLTCVQPSYRPHQLRTTDLNLLMHFCSQQLENNNTNSNNQGQQAVSAELWLPVCLPRFHASGFLYCYTTRLDLGPSPLSPTISNNNYLTLALVSQMGSTEQFQLFRTAATRIRHALGLPLPKESPVLTILSSSNVISTTDQTSAVQEAIVQPVSNSHNDNNNDDVAWRRSFDIDNAADVNPTVNDDKVDCQQHDHNGDEDYVDASGDGNGIIPYVGTVCTSTAARSSSLVPTFCAEVHRAMDPWYVQDFVTKEYLRDLIITSTSSSSSSGGSKNKDNRQMCVRHFLFRFNAPIRIMPYMNHVNSSCTGSRHFRLWNNQNSTNSTTTTTTGRLTQCISSWLGDDANDDDDFIRLQNKIWSRYQKLNLRLRLGSASFESVLGAWDMITSDATATADTSADNHSGTKSMDHGNNQAASSSSPGIGCHCPAMGLLESSPNFINGLTYIVDGKEMYLGMNGQDFELYVVLSSSSTTSNSTGDKNHSAEEDKRARSIPVQQGAALAARLARRLLLDQDKLFIAKPFTWKES